MYGHACKLIAPVASRCENETMYIAIDVSKEMEYIFLRSFLRSLCSSFLFSLHLLVSLFLSNSLVLDDLSIGLRILAWLEIVGTLCAKLEGWFVESRMEQEWSNVVSKLLDRLRALRSSLFVFPAVFSKKFPQFFGILEIVTCYLTKWKLLIDI